MITKPAPSTTDYIAFPKAMKILANRFVGATPEEMAGWIFMGPGTGGIAAYQNANELAPPPRFYFDYFMGEDYLSPLMACWFRQDDIDQFDPDDRYITGAALIVRWRNHSGLDPEAFIRAKIDESRLLDIHPTFGGTQGTFNDDASFPPLSAGLYSLKQIKQIEAEDAIDAAQGQPVHNVKPDVVLQVSNTPFAQSAPIAGACADFRLMEKLQPSEITIAFVGDTSESGLTGNNMLEISARSVNRRLSLAEFGLVDRRTGSLNTQAAILVGLAHKEKYLRSEEKNSAIMMRIRALFRHHMGIQADPFMPYHRETGWEPLFVVVDHRGRSDERAKRDAERKTLSFDQLQDQGRQFADDESEHNVDKEDAANEWLKKNDPKLLS